MQDFSWRSEGERPPSMVRLLYPVLGIAIGVLIGVALTSGAWDWGQVTTRAERFPLTAKDSLHRSRETDTPTTATASVAAPKENSPVIILNPTAVETPASPVAQVSPDDVVPPEQEQVETSTPRPVASTETPQQPARDYRALRLQMLRAVRP